jgi:hypothetical protein
MEVDLRILFSANANNSDLAVNEFAKNTTPSKLYKDKLKQVILTKYYLNNLLLACLPSSTTCIPLIQIMGFDCYLYALRKVENYYILETIDSVVFPCNHEALKVNEIRKIIGRFLTSRLQSI